MLVLRDDWEVDSALVTTWCLNEHHSNCFRQAVIVEPIEDIIDGDPELVAVPHKLRVELELASVVVLRGHGSGGLGAGPVVGLGLGLNHFHLICVCLLVLVVAKIFLSLIMINKIQVTYQTLIPWLTENVEGHISAVFGASDFPVARLLGQKHLLGFPSSEISIARKVHRLPSTRH